MQRFVKKIARTIASEHTARAICSMRGRRKSKNQQLRLRISEARDGFAPIFPVAKCEALFARDFLPVAHQARTEPALDDFFIQLFERVQNNLA